MATVTIKVSQCYRNAWDASRGHGIHWTRTQAIYSNPIWSEFVRKLAGRRFQRRFCRTHDIVIRHHLQYETEPKVRKRTSETCIALIPQCSTMLVYLGCTGVGKRQDASISRETPINPTRQQRVRGPSQRDQTVRTHIHRLLPRTLRGREDAPVNRERLARCKRDRMHQNVQLATEKVPTLAHQSRNAGVVLDITLSEMQ